MIPYPYNMVDMGGIDLAEANGTVVEGLYAKIVEAVDACGDVVLYNWKFAGIEIAPQHTSILIGDPIVINGAVQVTEQDEVTVPGINPEPPEPPEPPVLIPLEVDENGQYYPTDYDADGFSEVAVNVEGGSLSSEVMLFIFYATPPIYQGGYDYQGYVYNTQLAQDCGLVLLADASQGADSVQLTESISDFSGVVLQGIYRADRRSGYNSSIMYLAPQENIQYWAGMRDRNSTYTCYVTFDTDSTAVLSGNKQVLIYGIP